LLELLELLELELEVDAAGVDDFFSDEPELGVEDELDELAAGVDDEPESEDDEDDDELESDDDLGLSELRWVERESLR
jgi:hypothetical protein